MEFTSSKRVLACLRCSEKRVKCNRQKSCSNCVKNNAICQYRERKRRTRGSRGEQTNPVGDETLRSTREESQATQVENLTTGNDQLSKQTESEPQTPQTTFFAPQLLRNQENTSLIDNSLWSRVAEEALSDDESTDGSVHNNDGVEEDDLSYLLGIPLTVPLEYPAATHAYILWQKFVENVDPMLKMLHIPTLKPAVEKAISDPNTVPKAFQALLFSIYSVAVLSVTDIECRELLGGSRLTLLASYIASTKVALTRAHFMSSASFMVLQALTIHIFSIRHYYEPRIVWNLTGLAFRIAQSMGISIDGALLGLPPFETEMRRRLWWQLRTHDFRAAELAGQAKFDSHGDHERSPRPPANVNDSELYPTMTEAPTSITGPTEIIWNVLRVELATFALGHRTMIQESKLITKSDRLTSEEYSALDDMAKKDVMSNQIKDIIETKYLRFCDASKPLELLVLVGARCATDHIRFVAHHPRRWNHQAVVTDIEKKLVWDLCLQLLDRVVMMQTLPQLQRFAWIVPYFIQWPEVIHVLDTLRAMPTHPESERAWNYINTLYHWNSEMFLNLKRPIFAAVGSLCLKAWRARSTIPDIPEIPKPGCITKLEQRSQQHHEKRQARRERKRGRHLANGASYTEHASRQEATDVPMALGFESTDSFWQQFGADLVDDSTGVDFNELLPPDYGFDNGETVNWDQWDAWLAGDGIPR